MPRRDARVVKRKDIGVVQLRHRGDFPEKGGNANTADHLGRNGLDRHQPAPGQIAGEEDRSHPALPEVPFDVVQAADDSGSTEYIIRQVKSSPAGSIWAVGTEVHLVSRLAREVAPGRTVLSLDQFGCLCSTMFRVSPNHLLWILEGLVPGEVHNRIVVPAAQKHWTKVALDRMLTIS